MKDANNLHGNRVLSPFATVLATLATICRTAHRSQIAFAITTTLAQWPAMIYFLAITLSQSQLPSRLVTH